MGSKDRATGLVSVTRSRVWRDEIPVRGGEMKRREEKGRIGE